MIKLYSGTPGSGKSLDTAKDIFNIANAKRDRLCIVNFPINASKLKHPERILFIDNEDLSPALLKNIFLRYRETHKNIKEGDIVLIIDEAQLLFNARDWNVKSRKDWLTFFSQHRKMCYKVYLVAQFDLMLDKQIRALIEYEVIHRKMTNFGLIGALVKLFTFGDVFIAIEMWYALGKKTGSYYFKASKKYYQLYDTFNLFEAVY